MGAHKRNYTPTLALPLATLVLILHFSSPALGQAACVMEATKCQCSSSTPSGMCMRSQGDGTCLLGACQAGYRCDCFGYEMCSISKCGKYVASGNDAASETVPFRCQRLEGNAECVVVQDVLDTDGAAQNAEADASTTNDEVTDLEVSMTAAVESMIGQKKVVNQMLKDIESVSEEAEEEELVEIDQDAEVVEDAIEESSNLVLDAVKETKKVGKELKAVRKLKREVRRKNREWKLRQKELNEEEKKPKAVCVRCEALKERMKELEKEKRKAARGCGEKAQVIRKCKKRAQEKLGACKRVRDRGAKSFHKCMWKVKKCLKGVSSKRKGPKNGRK